LEGDLNDKRTVALATDITIAWLANTTTRVASNDVPDLLIAVHAMLVEFLESRDEDFDLVHRGRVSERKSLASPDHIISMIDGKPYRTLTRHLRTNGLTPDEYRQRFGLSHDYPMVAQSFSEERRALARRLGLGKRPKVSVN
jgi:predicted transcriptional regulator